MLKRKVGQWAIVLIAVACVGCSNQSGTPDKSGGSGSSATSGHATPEAAFQAFKRAMDAEDWKAAALCLVPESRYGLAFGLVMGASFSTFGDESKEQSLNQLLTKHGINLEEESGAEGEGDMEQAMMDMFKPVTDLPGLIGELGAWIKQNASGDDQGGMMAVGELSEVKIEGDSATASVQSERGPMPIEFRKTSSGWLVLMPE